MSMAFEHNYRNSGNITLFLYSNIVSRAMTELMTILIKHSLLVAVI